MLQLENGLAEPDAEGKQLTATGLTLLREAIAELRTLQFELSPPVLAQSGLPAALQWLAERMGQRGGIPISWRMSPGDQPVVLLHALSVTLFQCTRELVYNLIKQAGASHGSIELAWDDASVTLVVADDGVGIAHSAPPIEGDTALDCPSTDTTAPDYRQTAPRPGA